MLAREPGGAAPRRRPSASQYVLIGALDVLFVVLAIGVLDLGGSGAGYLNAAFGQGCAGIGVTVTLVGRRRLAPPLALGAAVFSGAFLVIGVWPTVGGTVVLLVAAGAGRTLLDVAGRTLLQRASPPDALAGVFGVLEAGSMAGLAAGSLLVPALSRSAARGASIGLGAILPAVALVVGRRLLAVDSCNRPRRRDSLLRSLPLFAPLGVPSVRIARTRTRSRSLRPGPPVVRTGEPGDALYLIAAGEAEVVLGGRAAPHARARRGLRRAGAPARHPAHRRRRRDDRRTTLRPRQGGVRLERHRSPGERRRGSAADPRAVPPSSLNRWPHRELRRPQRRRPARGRRRAAPDARSRRRLRRSTPAPRPSSARRRSWCWRPRRRRLVGRFAEGRPPGVRAACRRAAPLLPGVPRQPAPRRRAEPRRAARHRPALHRPGDHRDAAGERHRAPDAATPSCARSARPTASRRGS